MKAGKQPQSILRGPSSSSEPSLSSKPSLLFESALVHAHVLHHGAKHTVTGSCHEMRINQHGVLIDCGLFQGSDLFIKSQKRTLDIEFSIAHIRAVILTHSHIDHIGRLPWLIAKGYRGPIFATQATCALLPLMLKDALVLQGFQHGQAERILTALQKQLRPVNYQQWIPIKALSRSESSRLANSSCRANLCYLRLQPAGHILGSAYVEFKVDNKVIVFSGDLGPNNTPLLPDPHSPKRADYLFIESTYGNKFHESIESRSQRLLKIIHRSLHDGGTILIPAFSVGRTQELLFDIESLLHKEQISDRIPIILDSALASKVTKTYRQYRKLWSKEAKTKMTQGRHPLAFDQCITINNYREHQRVVNRLAQSAEPAIVIAASGMCTGGRILNYLKALLPDKRTDVIFAGYQAKGTLGHQLQNGQHNVDIDNTSIPVKAQIHSMSGYSAHADQEDLIEFIKGIESHPKEVHLIHGEPRVKQAFADVLKDNITSKVII